jgi:SAM-dependent methyltransferase
MENKLFGSTSAIQRIAEIGPGDSLGIGLSAIYTGAKEYYAFDVIEHATIDKNSLINEELFKMFSSQEEIPNTHRQRFTAPILPSYSFPKEYLPFSSEYYEIKWKAIEKALKREENDEVKIQYIVPWMDRPIDDIKELDLIFSQAVMEHIDDIEFAYKQMYKWLRPGGVISHQIDFKTHEMTKEWNGHWFIGDKMWELLSHGRKYPMNRLPLSSHISLIEKAGFEIKFVKSVTKENPVKTMKPQVPNVPFTEVDLITSGALIQAIKN